MYALGRTVTGGQTQSPKLPFFLELASPASQNLADLRRAALLADCR